MALVGSILQLLSGHWIGSDHNFLQTQNEKRIDGYVFPVEALTHVHTNPRPALFLLPIHVVEVFLYTFRYGPVFVLIFSSPLAPPNSSTDR